MSSGNLIGPKAEVRMTLQITRAATGKVEEVELVGHTDLTPEQIKEQTGLDVQVIQPSNPQE